jgi:metacaspase-1
MKSLHIGLNYTGKAHLLSGCLNDAKDLQDFFANRGYESILLLEPTKAEIQQTWMMLISTLKDNKEPIVVSNSSHGSLVADLDGDEKDKYDEAMLPYDYESNIILDDELNVMFGLVPNPIYFISDSCHSETLAKFGPDKLGKGIPKTVKLDLSRKIFKQKGVRKFNNTVCFSGCEAMEYSYDTSFNGRPNGAFTRNLIDCYKEGMTWKQWHSEVRKHLPSMIYNQHPTITGLKKNQTKKV